MKRRIAWLAAGFGGTLALLAAMGIGAAQSTPQRISFAIATGPGGGAYFPVGEGIAGIISHPPGVNRCDMPGVCGPPGLIATARTSDGAVANVLAVNSGQVESALAQSDVVAEATAGTDAFAHGRTQKHVRAIAALFPEDVLVVAAKSARVKSIADLKGKRISVGAADSGTIVTARALLAAYGIAENRVRLSRDPADVAANKLANGQLDAFFYVGSAPVTLVQELVARGAAVLVPIDGVGRKHFLKARPMFAADTILGVTYGTKPIETVSVRAVWIVNDAQPNDLVYGIARALFNPANRDALESSNPRASLIQLNTAARGLPAPLHPGAARFYREMGVLPVARASK
jgi:uncharacterized protein